MCRIDLYQRRFNETRARHWVRSDGEPTLAVAVPRWPSSERQPFHSALVIACNLFDKLDDATPKLGVLERMKALMSASPSDVARKSDT